MSAPCVLCESTAPERIYTLDARAITSLCAANAHETDIWLCPDCGHSFTEPLTNLEAFYADNYNILTGSEEEDQLLKIEDGKKIFRSDFQARTLGDTVALRAGMRVLDYGGAKGATLKKIIAAHAVEPFIFDVSERYRPFWEGSIPPENQSVGALPAAWQGTMDVVYSFFCLEHVANPVAALAEQFALLKDDGVCYCVVPNLHTNVADLLVIDHIQHFSECSLRYAFAQAGFGALTVDATLQPGWWVVCAKRGGAARLPTALPSLSETQPVLEKTRHIAAYWRQVTERIASYTPPADAPIAIYGAGFYGTYACLHLPPHVQVACFIDQNSFLQGTQHLGKPVVSPAHLPDHLRTIVVALNPAHARRTMATTTMAQGRPVHLDFIFEDRA